MYSFKTLILVGPCLMTAIVSGSLLAAWRYLNPTRHILEWAAAFAVMALAVLVRGLFVDHRGFALPVAGLIVELLGLLTTLILARGFASRAGTPEFGRSGWLMWLAITAFIVALRSSAPAPVSAAAAAAAQGIVLLIAARLASRGLRRSGPAEGLALIFLVGVALMRFHTGWSMLAQVIMPTTRGAHAWVPAIMIEPACIGLMTMFLIASDLSTELNRIVWTDPLTGVMNRAGFESVALRALIGARFPDRPFSIAIADIDRFKAINDAHGHAAGDGALTAFAGAIARVIGGDKIGRIGGEEFALLLPGLDGYQALARVDRLRSATAALSGQAPAAIPLTASFGIAELSPGEALSGLLARADRALYRAKETGRDRCLLAPVALGD